MIKKKNDVAHKYMATSVKKNILMKN